MDRHSRNVQPGITSVRIRSIEANNKRAKRDNIKNYLLLAAMVLIAVAYSAI